MGCGSPNSLSGLAASHPGWILPLIQAGCSQGAFPGLGFQRGQFPLGTSQRSTGWWEGTRKDQGIQLLPCPDPNNPTLSLRALSTPSTSSGEFQRGLQISEGMTGIISALPSPFLLSDAKHHSVPRAPPACYSQLLQSSIQLLRLGIMEFLPQLLPSPSIPNKTETRQIHISLSLTSFLQQKEPNTTFLINSQERKDGAPG